MQGPMSTQRRSRACGKLPSGRTGMTNNGIILPTAGKRERREKGIKEKLGTQVRKGPLCLESKV